MKVSVTLSLDVDPAAWAAARGTSADARAVREAVRWYMFDVARRAEGVTAARLGIPSARIMPRP